MSKRTITFCGRWAVNLGDVRKRADLTFADFLVYLLARNIATFTFVKMTCLDYFAPDKRGEHNDGCRGSVSY
jgi:hypothetical protein